ncbi:MAG: glycosyltransferase family 4 protein [Phycisphaerales bacterium]
MRVLIVCESASMRMSGETALPVYYFRLMRARGVRAMLLTHERTRDELRATFDDDAFADIHFVEDSGVQRALWAVGQRAPERVRGLVIDQLIHLSTQRRARRLAKRLVPEHDVDVVFEPAPISPRGISCMYNLGAPVVVGPLCGGLSFPPGFRFMDGPGSKLGVWAGRTLSPVAHRLFPGKLHAAAVIVGSERTARALPRGVRGSVYEVVESGVDLNVWQPVTPIERAPGEPVRFVYLARFVDWKGIEYLVEAFARTLKRTPAVLELIGDGELYQATCEQVDRLELEDHVLFHGRLGLREAERIVRSCDVYMAPSLRECGGCALLEAMALGLPIVAANWAGPAEFLSDGGGALLVEPSSREGFIEGLTRAMVSLAESPELRKELGAAAAARVRTRYFDWDSKVDHVIEILRETVERQTTRRG